MAKSESLVGALQNISALSIELDRLKPLKKEDEERLWKKFRLEWNYNSNHIEGNTLTYQQTELLLIFEKAVGDHDLRELEEMKAHDVAVKLVKDYAADNSRELTEADIREWNKIILVRPFWGNAQTADGQSTRKLIQPGEYKREPNSVLLQNGEMFHYASPEETPAKMRELLEWYRKASIEKTHHPVEIAAQLHYEFVRIHPFDDSNGRTSRLLMNYVLLKNGYPPVVIKTADKKGYLIALNKADVGDLEAFIEYIAKQLIWSLQVNIKAASGESIEEQDDIDKEIKVWKKQFNEKNRGLPKSIELITILFQDGLADFLQEVCDKYSEFRNMFAVNRILFDYTLLGKKAVEGFDLEIEPHRIKNYFESIYLRNLNRELNSFASKKKFYRTIDFVYLQFVYEGFRDEKNGYLNTAYSVSIEFNQYSYSIRFKGKVMFTKEYTDGVLSASEKELVLNKLTKEAFEVIKSGVSSLKKG